MTELLPHKIYKHKNNTDVAFLVTSINDDFHEGLFVRGVWMNVTDMNKFHAMAVDSIIIKRSDVVNWVELKGEEHE